MLILGRVEDMSGLFDHATFYDKKITRPFWLLSINWPKRAVGLIDSDKNWYISGFAESDQLVGISWYFNISLIFLNFLQGAGVTLHFVTFLCLLNDDFLVACEFDLLCVHDTEQKDNPAVSKYVFMNIHGNSSHMSVKFRSTSCYRCNLTGICRRWIWLPATRWLLIHFSVFDR